MYVDKLAGELADTMSMCGAHSLAEITRNMVRVCIFYDGLCSFFEKRNEKKL